MIHKIAPSVDYNQLLKRLDTQLNEPANQNSLKVPKVVKPMNKKTFLQDFGNKCNKQPNIPSLAGEEYIILVELIRLCEYQFKTFFYEKNSVSTNIHNLKYVVYFIIIIKSEAFL